MTPEAEQVYQRLLVVRCQLGDETAFAELYGRYAARIAYFMRKLAGLATDDIAQEVWLDAWQALHQLSAPEAFGPWLFKIARRRAIRHLSKASRASLTPLEGDPAEAVDPGLDCFTADDAAAIHRALDQVSPLHREVLVLRFMEELDYEGIAAIVGCSVGTVRSRLHYAKIELRKQLDASSARPIH